MTTLRKYGFLNEFCQILTDVATFGWIDLQAGMIFLIQFFFCASKYMLVVYEKNCFGTVDFINNYLKQKSDFSLAIFPWEHYHLPGARDVLAKTSYI